MSTIQDVARLAGVSVATVSRVINHSGSVSDKTRENVMDAIKKLEYQPNLLGRNLRRTETRMILVLLPNISNPFYSGVVKGIEDVAHKNGYNILLCNTEADLNRERIYLELLRSRLADGVIFMAPELGREELSDIARSFPVVQCCEYREDAGVSHVSIDNVTAAYKAVKHLTGLGHRKIGAISSQKNFLSIVQREQGYRNALEEAGLEFNLQLIKYGDYSFKSGMRAAYQLLSMKDKPTAVFAISDMTAIGAIKTFRENGMRIPQDIAVMGFDNISFSSMCEPPLSTISQPRYDIGCTAMNILIKKISGEQRTPQNLFLEHELIIRQSTVI